MALALTAIGCSVGGLIAVATLLIIGLGPVVALFAFWIGAVGASLALAVSFVRSTILMAVPDKLGGSVTNRDSS